MLDKYSEIKYFAKKKKKKNVDTHIQFTENA